MNYFAVLASFLLGSLVRVHTDEVQINGKDCGTLTARTLIVNGTIAKENQFPWMVLLDILPPVGQAYKCGGSIFTKRHVLTAAHCTTRKSGDATRIDVFYGNNDGPHGKTVKVKKWIRHSKFNGRAYTYDIAVLLVEKPFEYSSNVRAICIPVVPMDMFNANTVVAGWGLLKPGAPVIPNRLRYTNLKILPNEMCSSVYRRYDKKLMYCAQRDGTGPCDGDSGGPLMARGNDMRYVQVGIVAFGHKNCTQLNKASFFTRVDAFIPWIMQVVRSLSSSDKAYSEEVRLELTPYTVPQWYFFSVPLGRYALHIPSKLTGQK